MFNDLITQITPFIQHYGAWGVFFISMIEEIVVPLPSSFSLLAAGFFLIPVGMSMGETYVQLVYKIALPAGAGFAIGSLFPYAVAYLGGEPIIERYGKWFGVSWPDIERWTKHLNKSYRDELILFGARVLPVVPEGLVSVVCGIVRYPARNFFIVTLIGSTIRAFLTGLLGWSLGEAFVIYADQLSELGTYAFYGVGVFLILVVAILFVRKRLKKRR